jgi:hypothetical protein
MIPSGAILTGKMAQEELQSLLVTGGKNYYYCESKTAYNAHLVLHLIGGLKIQITHGNKHIMSDMQNMNLKRLSVLSWNVHDIIDHTLGSKTTLKEFSDIINTGMIFCFKKPKLKSKCQTICALINFARHLDLVV